MGTGQYGRRRALLGAVFLGVSLLAGQVAAGDSEEKAELYKDHGLQLLSAFLGTEALAAAPLPDFPEWTEGSQFDERFFGLTEFRFALE